MAKRGSDTMSGSDRAKVRVFFAEVDGNNESIQEALRTMVSVSAMSRPIRVVSDQRIDGKSAVLLPSAHGDDGEELIDQAEEAQALQEENAFENGRKPRGTGKKTDRNAGINLVPDLNFRPNGQPTFKEFVEQKGAKSDVETVVSAVYYMQHSMKLAKIGPGHVMTAFKEIGKAVPVDLKQTIRNIKKSKMWLNFTDIEEIRTTTQGDNFVEHEMGKSD